uniref:Carbonic anhydrase n=1 Tax=Callorhinchus milii TaxID=7868 RepID=A0A4W3H2J0_CALMI
MFQFTQGHWTYQGKTTGDMDEEHWESQYPACAGKHQSPIDIQRKKTKYNPHLPQIQLSGYDAHYEEPLRLTNNGHSGTVSADIKRIIKGNHGLQNKFTAVQMHFHWGGLDLESSGSEHTVDGMRYIAELHIVHYNSEKYKTFEEAHDKEDGLAVLAFFYEVGLQASRSDIKTTQMHHLDISTMLSDDLSQFYRYKGSLTTPPCFESITWTVFDTPINYGRSPPLFIWNRLLTRFTTAGVEMNCNTVASLLEALPS